MLFPCRISYILPAELFSFWDTVLCKTISLDHFYIIPPKMSLYFCSVDSQCKSRVYRFAAFYNALQNLILKMQSHQMCLLKQDEHHNWYFYIQFYSFFFSNYQIVISMMISNLKIKLQGTSNSFGKDLFHSSSSFL